MRVQTDNWQSEYVREYVQHTKLFFAFFITQIILIVFFCGQINHLYDVKDSVYNNFIIEKHTVVCIMTKIVHCRTLQYMSVQL